MPQHTVTAEQDDDQGTDLGPVEGGRAWPVPMENPMLPRASWVDKPQRGFVSTGVVTADLLERTFG